MLEIGNYVNLFYGNTDLFLYITRKEFTKFFISNVILHVQHGLDQES